MRGDTRPSNNTSCGPTLDGPTEQPATAGSPQPAPSELRSFCEAVLELPARDSHSRTRFEKMLLDWARSLRNRLPVSAS